MAASGFEPGRTLTEADSTPGRRIASSGPDAAQVGHAQRVAGAAASKGRTEAVLPATDPGPRGSTARAQQEHNEQGGPAGVDSGSPDARSVGAVDAVALDLPDDLRVVVEAWPELSAAIQAGILAIVQACRRR